MAKLATVGKDWTLEALTTHDAQDVSRQTGRRTVDRGSQWNVFALEGDQVVLTANVGVPSSRAATIRVSLEEPGFTERWQVVGR